MEENPSNMSNGVVDGDAFLNKNSMTFAVHDETSSNGGHHNNHHHHQHANGNRANKDDDGIDNPAFFNDEPKKQHHQNNTTLGLASPTKGAGEPPLKTEAVNLELVNMAPTSKTSNGQVQENSAAPMCNIPLKKDTAEVDMSVPYDEYFVPVNEHRKYMRGEKLYVTKDKRTGKSSKRCVAWILGGAVVGAIVLLAILAGTGVFGDDAKPVNQSNFTESSARSFGEEVKGAGVFGAGHEHHHHNHQHEDASSVTPPPPIPTAGTPPTTDTTMLYVPKSIEGELKIDSELFSADLYDPNSTAYKKLAAELEQQLKDALFDYQTLNYGANDIVLKVVEFRPGSIVVKYRIGWEQKPGISNPPDPITRSNLKTKLVRYLQVNSGMLGMLRVDTETIKSEKIVDMCQFDMNGCDHDCTFDKLTMEFMCTCPENMYLDEMNKKKCMLRDNYHDVHDHHDHDHIHNPSAEPEPTGEPSAKPEPAAEPQPEPTAEPKAQPEPTSEPKPAAEPEPTSEPKSVAEPEPTSEPKAVAEPEPSSEPKTLAEPVPSSEPKVVAEPQPTSEPKAAPEPEPTSEPKTGTEPVPSSEPKVVAEPQPTSEPKVVAEPQPTSEPKAAPEPEPTSEPKVVAEPVPSSEPKAIAEPQPTSEPKAVAEPEPSNETKVISVLSNDHLVAAPEPSSEPTVTAAPEPTSEPKSITQLEPSSVTQSKDLIKNKTDEHLSVIKLHNTEPKPEPSAEPKSEPSAESKSDIKTTTEANKEDRSKAIKMLDEPLLVIPSSEPSTEKSAETTINPITSQKIDDTEIRVTTMQIKNREITESTPKMTTQEPSRVVVVPVQNRNENIELGPVVEVKENTETSPKFMRESSEEVLKEQTSKSSIPTSADDLDSPVSGSELAVLAKYLANISDDTTSERSAKSSMLEEGSNKSNGTTTQQTIVIVESRFAEGEGKETGLDKNVMSTMATFTSSSTEERMMMMAPTEPTLLISQIIKGNGENETNINIAVSAPAPVWESHEIDTPQPTGNMFTTTTPSSTTVLSSSTSNNNDQNTTTTTTASNIILALAPDNTVFAVSPEIEEMVETTTLMNFDRENFLSVKEAKKYSPEDSIDDTKFFQGNDDVWLDHTEIPKIRITGVDGTVTEYFGEMTDKSNESITVSPHMYEVTETIEDITQAPTEKPIVLGVSVNASVSALSINTENGQRARDGNMYIVTTTQKSAQNESSTTKSENVTKVHLMIPEPEIKKANLEHRVDLKQADGNDIAEPSEFQSGDMSPFLPELENNETLLRNLQEGHSVSGDHRLEEENNLYKKADQSNTTVLEVSKKNPPRLDDDELYKLNPKDEKPLESDVFNKTHDLEVIPLVGEHMQYDTKDKIIMTTLIPETIKESKSTEEVISSTSTTPSITLASNVSITTEYPQVNNTVTNSTVSLMDIIKLTSTLKPLLAKLADEVNATSTTTESGVFTESAITTMVSSLKELMQKQSKESPKDMNDTKAINDAQPEEDEINNNDVIDREDLGVVPLKKDREEFLKKDREKLKKVDKLSAAAAKKQQQQQQQQMQQLSEDGETSTDHFLSFRPLVSRHEFDDSKEGANNITTIISNTNITTTVNDSNSQHLSVPQYSKCASGQFQCVNGTSIKDGSYCVALSDRCDSNKDCTDGSDEEGCEEDGCPGSFQCSNGQCLKRHLVCNGILDCNDGSDEENCDSWLCNFDEMSCGVGSRCIPLPWKCDGKEHCPDGNDELNCPQICSEDQFSCTESRGCINQAWRCDGKKDCPAGEDEKLCECSLDQFRCQIGGGCIPVSQVCDGEEQCADFSDEWNCFSIPNTTNVANVDNTAAIKIGDAFNLLHIRKNGISWSPVCTEGWSEMHSDLVCQRLGYLASVSTESIGAESLNQSHRRYLHAVDQTSNGETLLLGLKSVEECPNKSLVTIQCQEFDCTINSPSSMVTGRVVGGSQSNSAQWPSVALLYNKFTHTKCTASIVSPKWLLTSYSCISEAFTRDVPSHVNKLDGEDWTVYGGYTYVNTANNTDTEVYPVRRIISYSGVKYNQVMYNGDLVGVELKEPLKFNHTIGAVCLANKPIEPRQLCAIAGWGVSQENVSTDEQYLYYLPVPTFDQADCNSTKHYNGLIADHHICAGYTDTEKSPCYNDEGAPLMCFEHSSSSWELHGLLSYHSNCGKSHHPAVFTSLTYGAINKWLRNTVKSHNAQILVPGDVESMSP